MLIVLNLRNGLGLANVEANTQTGVIGVILIVSVLRPQRASRFVGAAGADRRAPAAAATPSCTTSVVGDGAMRAMLSISTIGGGTAGSDVP